MKNKYLLFIIIITLLNTFFVNADENIFDDFLKAWIKKDINKILTYVSDKTDYKVYSFDKLVKDLVYDKNDVKSHIRKIFNSEINYTDEPDTEIDVKKGIYQIIYFVDYGCKGEEILTFALIEGKLILKDISFYCGY